MTLAHQYAKALRALIEVHPRRGKTYLKNLHAALASRGHEKLLPRIFSEYERLLLKERRGVHYRTVNPERERTKVLLELYRKLVHG